jgi:CTP:molybdopterin cytidylyltransferase MocA
MMIGGLILAAGEGTRFGPRPKLLEPLRGRPLLEHAIRAQEAVDELSPIVVVLGAHADELRSAIDFGRAVPIVCEVWQEGQSASLRAGLSALPGIPRVLVTLGDVPTVTPDAIRRLLHAPDGARAAYAGRPGHPVVLGPAQLELLSKITGDEGARSVLPAQLLIECSDLCSGLDVDTPTDLEAIRHAAHAVV